MPCEKGNKLCQKSVYWGKASRLSSCMTLSTAIFCTWCTGLKSVLKILITYHISSPAFRNYFVFFLFVSYIYHTATGLYLLHRCPWGCRGVAACQPALRPGDLGRSGRSTSWRWGSASGDFPFCPSAYTSQSLSLFRTLNPAQGRSGKPSTKVHWGSS